MTQFVLGTEEDNMQTDFTVLLPIVKNITQRNALENISPIDYELNETQTDEKCICSPTRIDQKCIEKSIYTWIADEPIICGGCFWQQMDYTVHECLLKDCAGNNFNNYVRDALLDKNHLQELFDQYEKFHEKLNVSLKKRFKLEVKCLLKRKMSELVEDLLEKDRRAHQYFKRNEYFKNFVLY